MGFCYGANQLRNCGNTFGAKEISTPSPSPPHFSTADCPTADALTTSNHLQTGHLEGGGDGALEEVSLWLLGASRLFGWLGRANTPTLDIWIHSYSSLREEMASGQQRNFEYIGNQISNLQWRGVSNKIMMDCYGGDFFTKKNN